VFPQICWTTRKFTTLVNLRDNTLVISRSTWAERQAQLLSHARAARRPEWANTINAFGNCREMSTVAFAVVEMHQTGNSTSKNPTRTREIDFHWSGLRVVTVHWSGLRVVTMTSFAFGVMCTFGVTCTSSVVVVLWVSFQYLKGRVPLITTGETCGSCDDAEQH